MQLTDQPPRARRVTREGLVAALLISCVSLVLVWEVLSARSGFRASVAPDIKNRLAGFVPSVPGWSVREVPVPYSPDEPNIAAYEFTRSSPQSGDPDRVFVRLVHGYNMRDCMRIKGYQVDLMRDHRPQTLDLRPGTVDLRRETLDLGPESLNHEAGTADTRPEVGTNGPKDRSMVYGPGSGVSHDSESGVCSLQSGVSFLPYQLWRVTSSTGDASLWITTMLRASDFAPTDIDVCSMPFPRVGTPDALDWNPRGLTLRSLLHPIRNFRLFLRAKWNAARCDWRTFLRLRPPAWVNDELLTLVTVAGDASTALQVHAAASSSLITDHRLPSPSR